jgi:hypothetical protein
MKSTHLSIICVQICDTCGGRELGVSTRNVAVLGLGLLLIFREILSGTVQRVFYFRHLRSAAKWQDQELRLVRLCLSVCLSVRPSVRLRSHFSVCHKILFWGIVSLTLSPKPSFG